MNLTEIKQLSAAKLSEMAKEAGLDDAARMRKQDIIFAILKNHAKSGEDIFGDGVLEILPDGFG
ncbi:MAG: Rho termination factor N-terminal domain-containing protein, partial [Kangiellaceae bacterium]|nr:Rho termination factor N-terminal domain-containing protein [Kangiellaceae bacterium]